MFAVMVVPIFSPKIIAAERSKSIQPLAAIVIVIATATLEDCTIIVNSTPNIRNKSTDKNPIFEYRWSHSSATDSGFMSGTEDFKKSRPISRRPRPTNNSPVLRHPGFLQNDIITPNPTSGSASDESSSLKPRAAIIQAVVVVPRFAPIITPILSRKVSKPAFTKLTTITVVAEDDCITAVTRVPEKTPLKRFPAIERMTVRRRSPETFWSPSLISFIP